MEQTRRARLTGLTAALLTVAAILWTLFASPSIGVVADGSYASAAEGLALRYAEESDLVMTLCQLTTTRIPHWVLPCGGAPCGGGVRG